MDNLREHFWGQYFGGRVRTMLVEADCLTRLGRYPVALSFERVVAALTSDECLVGPFS